MEQTDTSDADPSDTQRTFGDECESDDGPHHPVGRGDRQPEIRRYQLPESRSPCPSNVSRHHRHFQHFRGEYETPPDEKDKNGLPNVARAPSMTCFSVPLYTDMSMISDLIVSATLEPEKKFKNSRQSRTT